MFKQKITLIEEVFPKLRTLKKWLNKSLKSPVLEDPSRSIKVRDTKHC